MSPKNVNFDDERSQQLLSAMRGEEAVEEVPEKRRGTALDVAGNVVEVLESLPDVNHKQRRIAYHLAQQMLPSEIAASVGCSVAYVRALMPDPRITELVKMFRGGKMYEFAEDISAREVLNRAAVRAAEVLAEKMNMAVDEGTQLRAAIEVLKAVGEIGGNERQITEIVIERDAVRVFQKAVTDAEEDDEEETIQEADYEIEE